MVQAAERIEERKGWKAWQRKLDDGKGQKRESSSRLADETDGSWPLYSWGMVAALA
jgi:hypothetical protein